MGLIEVTILIICGVRLVANAVGGHPVGAIIDAVIIGLLIACYKWAGDMRDDL